MPRIAAAACCVALLIGAGETLFAQTRAWEGSLTLPTYPWEEDVNPKFWAMEGGPKLSTTVHGSIVYPYTMQDHLLRTKIDRRYKALFLENEYLKVTCLPELGGRIHSVLDKTQNKEMFYLNHVIKPGMIAMRGAWISGGIEWNSGPQGHTVTAVSPVDALLGKNDDGSVWLEINNVEKLHRTRWTVRLTLRPGRAYLDEKIRLSNPTDGMHPYYFWNCTAFPNRPGTRFIYPMSCGMDHSGQKFFSWPIHEGKDLTWLRNHVSWSSVFAYQCDYDFFGAYDVDADRGIVSTANHFELPGKKAWSWGTWDFGLVSQKNLTDEDGPYIEVQSGPLPTQSDYGMLLPHQAISWQEYWYPVHGLGDGFEFANQDVAIQTKQIKGKLEVRISATGKFPGASCAMRKTGTDPFAAREVRGPLDLSPDRPAVVVFDKADGESAELQVSTASGTLACFATPLAVRKVSPPDPKTFVEKPDRELTVEQKYVKGYAQQRASNVKAARQYYEQALKQDPGHAASLRMLAVFDYQGGGTLQASRRLDAALSRDPSDGLGWFYAGLASRQPTPDRQRACAYQAVRCLGTESLGYELVGRTLARNNPAAAVEAFSRAIQANPCDQVAQENYLLALYAAGRKSDAFQAAWRRVAEDPTGLLPRAVLALADRAAMARFVEETAVFCGNRDFVILDVGLAFAEFKLLAEASQIVRAACIDSVPPDKRNAMALYYLADWRRDVQPPEKCLAEAASLSSDFVFPSRPEELSILKSAARHSPKDANVPLHMGNLLAHLGRLEEAAKEWAQAAKLNPRLSVAWRNLGLYYSTAKQDAAMAAECYRKAIAARPGDQTLYRDLAEILIAAGARADAIRLMETMPVANVRRADITIALAQAYLDEKRYDQTLQVLESTPYFVNWEGQSITWELFNKARVARGRQRMDKKEYAAALADFEAALTYPANLGVGRSDKPEEAAAEYWRGKALEALGKPDAAREAWRRGAIGCEGSAEQNQHRRLCAQAIGKQG